MCSITTLAQEFFSVDHCCYDFSSDKLDKKCCDAEVIIPEDTSDEGTVNKVINPNEVLEAINEFQINFDVGSLAEKEKEEVCLAFPQDLQKTILNCQDFISMTGEMHTNSGTALEQAFYCVLIILIHVQV